MLLSDIFSIPFLICLAICILLIGCSSIYFYQRIMQQDHKIASMVSLISSMAEEPISGGATSIPVPRPQQQQQPFTNQCPIQQLITVSDDDESSDDESSSEDYDDNSEYSETSSENDGEEHILSAVDFDDLNVDLETSLDVEQDVDENNVEEKKDVEEEKDIEEVPISDVQEENTKSIHLDAEITDFTIFKSINISDDHAQPEETSYKKMSLTKLREIAQLNGHSDVSKLKKPELLKLLEAE